MIRKAILAGLLLTIALVAAPAGAQDAKPQYTVPEYNAYQACVNDAAPASKLKCFEGFETTYPQSTLLPYVYSQALQAAGASNNWAKIMEYADKVMGLGEKADVPSRFNACYSRATAFHRVFNSRAANAADVATKGRASAEECIGLAGQIVKPEAAPQAQFDSQMNGVKTLLNYTIGVASAYLKDFSKAVEAYRAALASNPGDALIRYQLGVNLLQGDSPQHLEGFWSLARAINLKVAGEAQVRSYLRNQIQRYQGGRVQCDKETDTQMAELLAVASTAGERPADYSIPSSAEIEAVQGQMNILSMMKGLKEGGKTAKIMWLASCGLEFPEVIGKVISAADNGSGVVVQVFTDESNDVVEAATAPNLEVHVPDQPDAARLKKDEAVQFSGHVARYTPEPFLVYFDKGKVDPKSIPEAEPAAVTKKTPKKAPAKKAAAKRPPPAR